MRHREATSEISILRHDFKAGGVRHGRNHLPLPTMYHYYRTVAADDAAKRVFPAPRRGSYISGGSFVRMESRPAQSVLPLVGLAGNKVIRDRCRGLWTPLLHRSAGNRFAGRGPWHEGGSSIMPLAIAAVELAQPRYEERSPAQSCLARPLSLYKQVCFVRRLAAADRRWFFDQLTEGAGGGQP